MKEIISTVGDATGAFAKSFGLTTAGVAKTAAAGTASLAKDIGPKRALIGAAILVVAVGGGIMLVRYLRSRGERELDAESMDASDDPAGERRKGKLARAESRAVNRANSIGR